MGKKTDPTFDLSELRRLAEENYDKRNPQEDSLQNDVDLKRLVHELQVHQIELEMQNEELQRARNEAEVWLARFTQLYDFAPVGYFSIQRNGAINQVNLTGTRLLGMDRTWLVGRQFGRFVIESDRATFTTFLEQVFESPIKQTCEVMLRNEGAETLWVEIEAVLAEEGQECQAAVMDIQARKVAEIKLQHLSMHDGLTGLYNRSYFEEAMVQLERGRHFPISIIMADVDHLKITNDKLGHAAGNEILKRVAHVLTVAFRAEDVIARIGGDEFVVLLPGTNEQAGEVAVRRLSDILHEHNTNYFTEEPVQISVGISMADFGGSLTEALKVADADMYRHKGMRDVARYKE